MSPVMTSCFFSFHLVSLGYHLLCAVIYYMCVFIYNYLFTKVYQSPHPQHPIFIWVLFSKTGSQVAHAGLEIGMWLRMALNSASTFQVLRSRHVPPHPAKLPSFYCLWYSIIQWVAQAFSLALTLQNCIGMPIFSSINQCIIIILLEVFLKQLFIIGLGVWLSDKVLA